MNVIPAAPYLPTDDPELVESTPLAGAGWYENGQHGGVVSALLGRAVEATPSLAPMEVARLTVELFRIVPIVPLRIRSEVLREGKRIQAVAAYLSDRGGTELARAVGLRLRTTRIDLTEAAIPKPLTYPAPDELSSPDMTRWGIGPVGQILYHRHAVEVREIDGGFVHTGPGSMWMRVVAPLVAGEMLSPLTRAVVVGDFVNGLSRLGSAHRYVFMNADLTVHLQRLPKGEWVGLSAESSWDPGGRGVATGRLFDTGGAIGRSTQTLFIDRAP